MRLKREWMLFLPYDGFHRDSTMYFGTEFECLDFPTKKEMLLYLQKNIFSEKTKKPFNYKTLKSYKKLGIAYRKGLNIA